MSYDYSGHNKSPPNTTFSLSGSIKEIKEAILYAISEAQSENIPLHIDHYEKGDSFEFLYQYVKSIGRKPC